MADNALYRVKDIVSVAPKEKALEFVAELGNQMGNYRQEFKEVLYGDELPKVHIHGKFDGNFDDAMMCLQMAAFWGKNDVIPK
jgi:hypothetical protein